MEDRGVRGAEPADSGAARVLEGLAAAGIGQVFVNAGTDFAPLAAAAAAGVASPRVVPVAHEGVAIGMAIVAALVTG